MTNYYSAYDTRFTRLLALLKRNLGHLDATDTEIFYEAQAWYYSHRRPKTGRPQKALLSAKQPAITAAEASAIQQET